jgi:PAS domain-containing protein
MSGRPGPTAEAPLLSAAQLRQIIDGATDTAIISIDRAGFVTSWSLGAQRLLGWTEEEMLGQKLDRLFTETRPVFPRRGPVPGSMSLQKPYRPEEIAGP